jgi:dephospho-CoA kinase
MNVVGLTGGIASGKSFVSNYLKTKKIPVHESDQVIKSIYKNPSNAFLLFLKKLGFKNAIKKKFINTREIRKEIFNDKDKKKIIEKYLHTEVRKNRDRFLKKHKNKKIVFLDIPLLFENNLDKTCNLVCSVIAPLKIRRARAMNRIGMNKKILEKIIRSQTHDMERKKRSDFIIDTSKSRIKTCLQVDKIIYDILNI